MSDRFGLSNLLVRLAVASYLSLTLALVQILILRWQSLRGGVSNPLVHWGIGACLLQLDRGRRELARAAQSRLIVAAGISHGVYEGGGVGVGGGGDL